MAHTQPAGWQMGIQLSPTAKSPGRSISAGVVAAITQALPLTLGTVVLTMSTGLLALIIAVCDIAALTEQFVVLCIQLSIHSR